MRLRDPPMSTTRREPGARHLQRAPVCELEARVAIQMYQTLDNFTKPGEAQVTLTFKRKSRSDPPRGDVPLPARLAKDDRDRVRQFQETHPWKRRELQ